MNHVNVKRAQDSESPIGEGHTGPLSTTHNRDFGERVKTTMRDVKFANGELNAPPAGGAPTRQCSTELKAQPGTGMIGERFKQGDDPKNCTASQRSWMASAPEIKKYNSCDRNIDASYMSLSFGSREEEKRADNGRSSIMGLTTHPSRFQKIDKLMIFQDE